MKNLTNYISSIENELLIGNATEHTHRSALKALIEALGDGIVATNEPRRIECGAPDFVVSKGSTTVGYIEAKDVGKSLEEAERSEQLTRYRDSLTNLILTDYLEFRWYVDGECRLSARLGAPTKEGKIKRDKNGVQAVAELLSSFLDHRAAAVGTPKELALHMARLAHMIRNLTVNAFAKEAEGGSLHNQLAAFRDNLIPDLSVEQFADMYAQTITYGLFAARCTNSAGKDFTRQNAAYLLPKTNPFLRKLFNHIAGPDLDDRIAWLVDDLVQVLAQADMEAVLKDFGRRTAKEDPVVHFYETFLTAYDPKVREMRGVYYTPEPVVSYIVRSIDHLLKARFDKSQGLADPNVYVLDPAVGTATFLYMVINEIHEAMVSKGQQGTWNNYVTDKLLKRLFGFELLMAPYAVAHLKLGLLLKETGYQFKSDQRLGIYLTNTLEEAIKHSETLFAQWITEEANAAAEIKKEKPIMVVLGNPPYSGISANKGEWITQLINGVFDKDGHEVVKGYKTVDGEPLRERKLWLQDDYVKFIRFGQWRIERTGQGILGFITNHAYLDNPTFRGMRQTLMDTFNEIYILDLHGSTKKPETAPDGSKDENVFAIQQGVTVSLFIKERGKGGPAKVYHAELWGPHGDWPSPQPGTKYYTLSETDISTTEWTKLQPNSPFYFFVPRNEEFRTEYEKGWSVTEIFPQNSVGIVTARDKFAIDFDRRALERRIDMFRDLSIPDETIQETFNLGDTSTFKLTKSRGLLSKEEDWEKYFAGIAYRPFDKRHIYYTNLIVERPLLQTMQHMLVGENVGLLCCRQQSQYRQWSLTGVVDSIVESCYLSNNTREINYIFPLYLYPTEGEMQFEEGSRPNLNPKFVTSFSDKLRLKFIGDGKGDLKETFGPEDIFNYAYAIFHSPTYRSRYAEFLKIDFPRLPLTADRELFKALTGKGAKLVSLHLMESPVPNNLITKYPVTGSNVVEKVSYNEANKRVYINQEQYFEAVPPEVWNFHIGGYQVCQKWLKDRRDRMLTYDELNHYQKVVVAINETIRLMTEIDVLIGSYPIA